MLDQRGFSSYIVIAILALLGIGFYAGATSQKSVESTPTSIPKVTPKPTSSPLPAATPTPVQSLSNTSDSNAPTFIKVSSPNGGESFEVGDSMHITWSSNNLYKSGSCVVTLAYDNGSKSSTWVPVNTPNGYFDWKLTAESGDKQAKADMQCYDSGSNGYNDQSDNYFTITN